MANLMLLVVLNIPTTTTTKSTTLPITICMVEEGSRTTRIAAISVLLELTQVASNKTQVETHTG